MADASLPTLTMAAADVADIVARFGGEDGFTAWLRESIYTRLERIAVTEVRAQVNTQIRDAVEAKLAALPPALTEPPA